MKKILVLVMAICAVAFAVPPKGGCAPLLATCCFGPRVGLEMNEGTRLRTVEQQYLPYTPGHYAYISDALWGPFTGETMNDIRDREKLGGLPVKSKALTPEQSGGCGPLAASCCLGPRVAYEMNDNRKLRSIEWWYVGLSSSFCVTGLPLQLIPQIMMAKEAWDGKTMSEVVAEETLDVLPPPVEVPKAKKKK